MKVWGLVRKLRAGVEFSALYLLLANIRQKTALNEIFLNPAANSSLTHQTVQTLVAPGDGGLPGPDTEVVRLQGLVQTAQE